MVLGRQESESTIVGTSPTRLLAQIALGCGRATDLADLLARSLPLVVEMSGARSAYVVLGHGGKVKVAAHAGAQLPTEALPSDLVGQHPGWHDLAVSKDWNDQGIQTVLTHRLLGAPGTHILVLAFDRAAAPDDLLETMGALLETAAAGAQSAADLADVTQRVDVAQQLANMGDYDWHIASNTNRWSDQLYRIYGHEPQSFNVTYEQFVSHLHPDDRERVLGIHQEAYGSGEPYQMIERVQRPSGETRYLSSTGQVILDEAGTPTRMRGTCIDITDLVLAEQEIERAGARFEALVESSADAILVLEGALIVQTNDRGRELLGGDPVGLPLDRFVYVEGPEARGVSGRGFDGQQLTLDITASELNPGVDDDLVAVFLRDAAPRLANEALSVSLHETRVRRRQAVEINDNILQSLTASVYSLEDNNVAAAAEYIQLTLSSARAMMSDLLEPVDGGDLAPGDLVRENAATLSGRVDVAAEQASAPVPSNPVSSDRTVLIVDDSEDMRVLAKLFLDRKEGVVVVGEAASGQEGIRLAEELQPDLVILDLAMPGMDGLEALPQILVATPKCQVIVLSGFDQKVGNQALALGASGYVQKGGGFDELMRAVDRTLPRGDPPEEAAS